MIKSNVKSRLKKLEKKAGAIALDKRLKIWKTQGSLKDTEKQVKAIEEGKVKHPDGSFYSPEDFNLFVNCIFLTDEEIIKSEQSRKSQKPPEQAEQRRETEEDQEAQLIRELEGLEARLEKLKNKDVSHKGEEEK